MLIKALHITLVFSLLTSSVGVVLNQHFCQNELKNTALYAPAESCHVAAKTKQQACPFHQQQNQENGEDEKDCCSDSSHYLKSNQEQQLEQLDLPTGLLFPSVPAVFLNVAVLIPATTSLTGRLYRPPPLLSEPTIRFQVFRL